MSELKGPDVNVEAQDLKYTPERAEQLLQNYRRVLERIRAAEQDRSGVRTEQSAPVRLVTVTKFFPASDAAALLDGGVTLFGENRDQEASAKARELAAYCEQRAVQPPHWAFIGQLQTNKAKSVVKYASSVHSVDRPSLADALAKAYANQLTRYEAGRRRPPRPWKTAVWTAWCRSPWPRRRRPATLPREREAVRAPRSFWSWPNASRTTRTCGAPA